jgi:hypothetical protein
MAAWAAATREYLNSNSDVNVVVWSWCGTVSGASEKLIDGYLNDLCELEEEFPAVRFVYMTGHLDGTGSQGNLHARNEQIRAYCLKHGKVLYDFADIERFDPDGVDYLDKLGTDGCNWDADGDGKTSQKGDPALPQAGDRNWALDWQARHKKGVDWLPVEGKWNHTQALNVNLKANAAWHLWARLAGWDGAADPTSR